MQEAAARTVRVFLEINSPSPARAITAATGLTPRIVQKTLFALLETRVVDVEDGEYNIVKFWLTDSAFAKTFRRR
jgi:hypothetical protein